MQTKADHSPAVAPGAGFFLVVWAAIWFLQTAPTTSAAVPAPEDLALMATGALFGVLGNASADADPLVDMDPGARSFRFVFAVTGWLVLVAIIGFASGGSRRGAPADAAAPTPAPLWRGRAQRYANEAVLPFYVLHQPVIVAIGFFVLGWGLPAIVEYLLISVMALIGTLLVYDLLVRRTPVTRFLFGMKVKRG